MPDYTLEGYKYGSTTPGTPGGVLTWALDTAVPSFFAPVLQAAFDDWSSRANIQFQQVQNYASATIKFTLSYIDGLNNVLGTGGSTYWLSSSSIKQAIYGSVNFDSGEGWHPSGNAVVSNSGINLFNVAVHEIGHVIGMDHYNDAPAIMNSILNPSLTDLTQSDIDGIRYLYGPSPFSSPVATPAAPLVSSSYYLANNPDVAQSGMDPLTHYNLFGWKEGRNPDALFSTAGYLAANMDVAKAGSNPLTHYDTYGWKEGRDPSAAFDNEQYLLHNPDVKASGIDPLMHYMLYGQAEGRQIYAAIGNSSSFNHGSFDAEYYLLANPDVAKAALASGGDSFAFAYQHYSTFGWQENRKADAYFDPAYYLAHNPDVAAAHVDPLAHYDTFGWKEGRNASADFNTAAYLAANPDVAAAHIDPLTHYLQWGNHEGRHLA